MKIYELTYLISGEVSEEVAKDIQNKVVSLIQEEGGVLKGGGENVFLRKKLAYSIKGQTQAFLLAPNFQLNPESVANLEKKIRETSQVLRYLILVKPPVKEIKITRVKPSRFIKPKPKIELKEIEKKLEEILNESQ